MRITFGEIQGVKREPHKWTIGRGAELTLAWAAVAVLLICGCGNPAPEEWPTRPVDGESPVVAAKRIYRTYAAAWPGSVCGSPQACPAGFNPQVSPIPVQWVVYDAVHAVRTGLFRAMRTLELDDTRYAVPVLKGGVVVGEFDIGLNRSGHWRLNGEAKGRNSMLVRAQRAEEQLRDVLGSTTEVRTALFLPSGLIFVVGRNATQEAAVYFMFFNSGPGVLKGFDKRLPANGRLFTPTELFALLS